MNNQAILQSERDIAKYFSLSSVSVRPEAAAVIHQRVLKLPLAEQRRAYLDLVTKKVKDRQAATGAGEAVLDLDTAVAVL